MTASISRRILGRMGPSVSVIGLGCMVLSDFYAPAEQAQNLALLHHALDCGVNFLDTSDMYGVGRNEKLLAEVLATRRADLVLATKFGFVRAEDGRNLGIDGRPEYVAKACDASLARLGVDHIDLYYQHRVDPKVPVEDTVGAMARLVQAGKVRYLGLSEASASTVRRAARVHPIAALQSEYSLWTRDIADTVLPTCRELGIGFVAYSPLGRGFLTGAIHSPTDFGADDWRRQNPRFQGKNFQANRRMVDALGDIASARGCTLAQLALAWLLHQGEDIFPIPGTRRIERLDENIAAARLALTQDDLGMIDRVLAEHHVAGDRYPAAGMAIANADSIQ